MTALATLLEGGRIRLALSQEALAALVGVSQQTVSNWEKGLTQPRFGKRAKLAEVLNLELAEIEAATANDAQPPSRAAASVSTQASRPVRPLTPVLPFNSLSADEFERFVTDLAERHYPGSEVSQLGGQGDDQQGYDILVVTADGRRIGVQCKREDNFGPAKVAKAVKAAESAVDDSIIALGRTATAAARFEMDKHAGWRMWDQADLSRKVRQLADESAQQLVRAHFPGHVEPFLGIPAASPWMTAEELYRPSPRTPIDHRQALVGRHDLLADVAAWVADLAASSIGLLLGRGGLGKSKLLWELATRPYDTEINFRFLGIGLQPTPSDFELLPRTNPLVLVLDDAHAVEHVAAIVAQLWKFRDDARVLLAARPYGETQLESEIWRLNQKLDPAASWKLDDLTQTEASELVSDLLDRPVTDPFTKQLAAISADCPFLAVVGADLLKRGQLSGTTLASDAALRDDVFGRYSIQMTGDANSADAAQRRAVLSAIAAFQPVRLDDDEFVAAISALTKIEPWDVVNGRIYELEDAGLVLRRGTNAIRVVPDIFGDILLGQAAYDARAKRATTFLARAQEVASGAALQHLLVNASRMDWQVRDGQPAQADIVGNLWATLRDELLEGTYEQQVSLLKLTARIAYYQPDRALELVQAVLAQTPDDKPDESSGAPVWVATRADVVHATVPVLRNVAYHLDQLRPALEILWTLAQDDRRPTNQYPDHPLRVLQHIADLSTGKPFVYIDEVIDAATDWLASPSSVSPFEVINPILATEGTDETSSDLTLTFHAYGIRPEEVRAVRDRVVDLAFEQAVSQDVPAAARAIDALEQAIRFPMGMFGRQPSNDERSEWAAVFVPILNRLGQIGADPDHDPAVRVAIRQAVSWHAEHSFNPDTKVAAQAVLDALVRTSEDDLALCIHDGWGRMAMRSGLNFEEAERARVAEFRRVAEVISTGQSDREVLEHLEQRLHIERVTSTGYDSAGRFLFELFEVKPTAAALLCEVVSTSDEFSELCSFTSIALGTLSNRGDARAVEFAVTMLGSDDERLQFSAANAFSWNRGGRVALLPGEADVLVTMAAHANATVRMAAGRAVFFIAMGDKALALDLLSKIRFDGVSKVASEALSAFVPQGHLSWSDTDRTLRKSILAQLVECPDLNEYEVTNALSELSYIEPLRVTKFLIARVDRRAKLQDYAYDALPYHWEPPLRVRETNGLARCLIEVRDWMTKRGQDRRRYFATDDGADLFKLVAGDWSDQTVATLLKLREPVTAEDLVAVAGIIGHAPIAVLLSHDDAITKLLRLADSMGKTTGEAVGDALLPTNYGVFTMWSGQQPTKDVQERDEARRVAARLPRGSVESRFYGALADALEDRINFTRQHDEPRHDGRDW
jgi:transcriptional regulator with XRE-family HTH domain